MRGRPGCPTGQKKHSVGATGGSPPLFYKERLGTGSPPHPPQCAHWGTFPPRGRLWAVLPFPSAKPPLPARPAGGRAVTGVGCRAAGQSRNIEKTSPWPPTRERWVQGGENLSPPWCSFLRLSSKESRAPARSRAGNHVAGPTLRRSRRPPKRGARRVGALRGAAPRGWEVPPHLEGTYARRSPG